MNIITKLNIRQRVMLVLTVLAGAFLIWQIYNFVHGNAPTMPARSAAATVAPVMTMPSQIPQVRPLPADVANPALTSHQQEYLSLVREYQVTKMKRQILEEEAGLANAQKRIVDAGKNGSLPYVDNFGNDNSAASSNYQLTYLDRQAGQWTATISLSGQYTEVHVGTRLADGVRVIAISSRGVVLQSAGGKNFSVGFQGSVNVDNNSPAYSVNNRIGVKKAVKPVVSSNNNNPNNAQIAKMLGITSAPPSQATGALTVPVSHDVPAGPLTVTIAPTSAPTSTKPTGSSVPTTNLSAQVPSSDNSAQAQVQPQPQANPDQSQVSADPASPPAPTVRPVSVKELRQYNTAQNKTNTQSIDQLSWQQSADQQNQSEH